MALVEILTIGREILDGRVVDTNSSQMALALAELGLTPRFAQRVDDELERIIHAFHVAAERAQIMLVTGGLGPTSDDLTAQAFAKYRGEPLVCDETALKHIAALFEKLGRPLNEAQKKQAYLPLSCFMLPNPEGTAPGFGLSESGTHWFFMPGVPREMLRMLREQVLPRLRAAGVAQAVSSMTWATQFTSEGSLQELLAPVEKQLPPGFELTYRTRFPENHIALYARGTNEGLLRTFAEACTKITAILGADVFATAHQGERLQDLEEIVVTGLAAAGACLTTVESCTGGLVANRITNVSGSSRVFWGSHITYDNAAKELLGVQSATLLKHGAVSEQTARELAEAGLQRMLERPMPGTHRKKSLCVATTGIAGPGGGSETKPVGLCFIALAIPGRPTQVLEVRARLNWDRAYNKIFFSQKALELVRQAIQVQFQNS